MKRIFGILIIIVLIGIFQPINAATARKVRITPKPAVNAHAAVLMDMTTGKVLYKKNFQAIMAPASTTKIMTAVLVLEQLNLDKTITVGNVSLEGTSLDLVKGERKPSGSYFTV